jgi:hypothetical protein
MIVWQYLFAEFPRELADDGAIGVMFVGSLRVQATRQSACQRAGHPAPATGAAVRNTWPSHCSFVLSAAGPGHRAATT